MWVSLEKNDKLPKRSVLPSSKDEDVLPTLPLLFTINPLLGTVPLINLSTISVTFILTSLVFLLKDIDASNPGPSNQRPPEADIGGLQRVLTVAPSLKFQLAPSVVVGLS